jgi:hypothetical protein
MKTSIKSIIEITCLVLFLFSGTSAFACREKNCPHPRPKLSESLEKKKCPCPKNTACADKVYLQSNDIDIINNQIYVRIEDQIVPAIALYSDNEGIFVLTKKRQGRCPEEYWECSTCTGCSPWHAHDCDWCGYD